MGGMQAMGGGVGDAVPIKLPLGDTRLWGSPISPWITSKCAETYFSVFHANIYSIVAQIQYHFVLSNLKILDLCLLQEPCGLPISLWA